MNILWQKEKVHRRSLPAAAPPCGPRWAGPHKEKSEKERGRRDRRGERDGDGVVTLPYGFHANSATTSDKIRVKIVQVSKVTWFCKLRDGIQFYNPMTRWDWTLWPNIEGPPILGPKSKPNNRSASRDGEGVAGNRRRRGGWRRDTGAQQGHRRRLPYETRRRSGDWIAAELSPSLSPPAVGKQRAARRGGESLLRHRQRGQWDYLLAPLRDAATSPSASSPLRTVHWTWRLHLARDAARLLLLYCYLTTSRARSAASAQSRSNTWPAWSPGLPDSGPRRRRRRKFWWGADAVDGRGGRGRGRRRWPPPRRCRWGGLVLPRRPRRQAPCTRSATAAGCTGCSSLRCGCSSPPTWRRGSRRWSTPAASWPSSPSPARSSAPSPASSRSIFISSLQVRSTPSNLLTVQLCRAASMWWMPSSSTTCTVAARSPWC